MAREAVGRGPLEPQEARGRECRAVPRHARRKGRGLRHADREPVAQPSVVARSPGGREVCERQGGAGRDLGRRHARRRAQTLLDPSLERERRARRRHHFEHVTR